MNSDRKWIPTELARELRKRPCVICGIHFGIHCDHITPVVRGGRSVASNLQPLCRDCNYAKKHLKDNADTALVIASRGVMHFLVAFYNHATKYVNAYDRPTLNDWARINPKVVEEAKCLHAEFVRKLNA